MLRSHQAEFTELLLLHDFCRSATHHTLLLFYSSTGTVLSPCPTGTGHTCARIYYVLNSCYNAECIMCCFMSARVMRNTARSLAPARHQMPCPSLTLGAWTRQSTHACYIADMFCRSCPTRLDSLTQRVNHVIDSRPRSRAT